MRILHIVHQYPPDKIGGAELYTQAVSRALARRGHAVAVFYRRDAPGRGLSKRDEDGVQVYAAWDGAAGTARRFLLTFGNRFLHQAFRQVLEEFRPEIIHIQHLMGLPVSLADEVHRRSLLIIITLHDYWWICANAQLLTNYSGEICEGPRGYWNCARCALARTGLPTAMMAISPLLITAFSHRNRLLRQVVDTAHLLIAPTEFVRRWYISYGFPEEQTILLPHGLEYPAESPQRHRSSNEGIRFLYVGGLSWQKGVHTLVEAFAGVQGSAELWIAGDESVEPGYVTHLRTLAGPNVRFLGRLSREEVWKTLAQVDVVVVPSLWYETYSFLISEAFAAGLPVLASRLGALADRVRDSVDGLLLPPGDVPAWRAAIQRLIDEPDLLARLRANVRPPMTMEEHVAHLEALYAQIVDRNPASW
ncbi:MAG: glycosyltransferase family 4 protein [Thermoflexales bacterium]|nr:glycosyltransferase family 4 protein [Thermoflexales bacterium]